MYTAEIYLSPETPLSNALKIVRTQSAIWSLGLRLKIPNIKYLEDCVHTVCDIEPGIETEDS